MRFGLFYQASAADGQTHAERYAEMLDLIALGDTLGFDVAWLAELHFGGAFSLLASPLMVVPVIAQRTKRIRIGDLGLSIYSGTTTTPLPQLREYMALYRAHLAAAGHTWQPDQMALMLPVHVGATSGAARDAMRAGVLKYYRNIETIFAQLPDSYGDHLPRLKTMRETIANLPYETFCRDQGVFGDAAEVVDRLQTARDEFELSQIICWFDQGSMLPRAEVERAMRQFTDEVMPKLR